MDSFLHAVCPQIVRMVLGEMSKFNFAAMPNFGVQLVADESWAKTILQQHVRKGVQEIVVKGFQQRLAL